MDMESITLIIPAGEQEAGKDDTGIWRPKFIYLSLINNYELSHLDSQEIKPVSPKENQPWIFTGKIDTEVEAPIVWRPDAKSQLTGKDSDVGKDWRQDEKGATEHEMVGCRHHQLSA